MNEENLIKIQKRAKNWLLGNFDEFTKTKVKELLEDNSEELIDSFYKDLEFGTGGLRGIMGVGTNRMNKYTVGMATQGLANYLKKNFKNLKEIKVSIAHDCRNNSRFFAETVADVFSANDIKVYLFESLRPTPELSFAIRHFSCQSGVNITASHNPKEYNGFKAYWKDGGQLVNPHDINVVNEARKINIEDVKFNGKKEKIFSIGKEIDEIYLKELKKLSLSPEIIERNKDIKIVYTPIHGTGVKMIPECLKNYGFSNIFNVPEQDKIDGNFPTVISPNPENTEALKMALDKAKEVDADIVMATDPDADRIGIAVKDLKNNFILLNGNQTNAILIDYLLKKWQENGKLKGKEYVINTIVSSEIIKEIAKKYFVEYYEVLTGFKFFAEMIEKNENKKTYIGGGEESYGFLAGDFVRDKDAVSAASLIAEVVAYAKDNKKTIFENLIDIYKEYGFYKESLLNIVKKGQKGEKEISEMMKNFRENPPEKINNINIILKKDYLLQEEICLKTNKIKKINLPKSNVLQFILEDGSKISVRPSGTEPKIKFYFSVKENLKSKKDFYELQEKLDNKLLDFENYFNN